MRRTSTAAIAVLLVFLFSFYIGLPLHQWRSGQLHDWRHLGGVWIQLLPAIPYVYALVTARRVFAGIGQGETFSATLARRLFGIGGGVFLGATLNVVFVTNAQRWLLGEGSYLYFDLSGIVLGIVGVLLMLLGRFVDHAARMQAELEDFI